MMEQDRPVKAIVGPQADVPVRDEVHVARIEFAVDRRMNRSVVLLSEGAYASPSPIEQSTAITRLLVDSMTRYDRVSRG